ncbi:hypothetical protein ACTFIR_000420 [Dictyostelium discoideum]
MPYCDQKLLEYIFSRVWLVSNDNIIRIWNSNQFGSIASLTDKDWDDDGMLKLVKESCKIFSQKGYFHKDLSKRHVTKYTKTDKIKILFIDLSRVEKIHVVYDNINLRSSNTKQERLTPFKAPKGHQ